MLKCVSSIGAVVVVVYSVFLLKLGQFTFVQHVRRIWQTEEVGELKQGIVSKVTNTRSSAVREIRMRLAATRESEAQR
jgi:hypothetical protein